MWSPYSSKRGCSGALLDYEVKKAREGCSSAGRSLKHEVGKGGISFLFDFLYFFIFDRVGNYRMGEYALFSIPVERKKKEKITATGICTRDSSIRILYGERGGEVS